MVRQLWDRQQISDVMLRFGRGLDLHDWDMYAATLTDPFEVDFFDLTGRPPAVTTPKVWARFASACLERLVVMHRYSNFHINVDGDQADGVFYHISRHRMPNRFGDDHYTQYGWYENSFRRTAEGWKISRRPGTNGGTSSTCWPASTRWWRLTCGVRLLGQAGRRLRRGYHGRRPRGPQ